MNPNSHSYFLFRNLILVYILQILLILIKIMRVATFLDLNQTLDRLILKTSLNQRTDSKVDLSSDQTFLVHAQLPPCLYAPLLASLKPLTIQVLSLSRTEKGSIKMVCTAPVGSENISLLLAQALLDHLKTNSISSASDTFLKTLKSYPEKFINAKSINAPLVVLPQKYFMIPTHSI